MSSSAAETVANIEELLTKILVPLPPRSVGRFKCVSKHWLTLLSDPRFFCRHSQQNSKISGFFSSKIEDNCFNSISLGNDDIPSGNPFKIIIDKIANDSSSDVTRLKIIQSCNGLFLCLRYFYDPNIILRYAVNNNVAYVVNPTTNQFLALSSPSAEENKGRRFMVRYALAFEPSISPYYKVVCVITDISWRHKIDIYSSETREWKKLPSVSGFLSPSDEQRHYDCVNRPMHFDDRSREGAVYCNGKVHWIRRVSNSGTGHQFFSWLSTSFSCSHFRDGRFIRDEGDVLHYFDINGQSLRLVAATPPDPLGDVKSQVVHRYFGESGGHLHLIEFYKHYDTQLDIMEMENDYSGWFFKYYVDLNRVINPLPRKKFVVLFISRAEEKDHKVVDDEDSSGEADDDGDDGDDSSTDYLWFHVPGKVISYNFREKTFNTSVKFANRTLFLGFDDRPYFRDDMNCPYMETLASL